MVIASKASKGKVSSKNKSLEVEDPSLPEGPTPNIWSNFNTQTFTYTETNGHMRFKEVKKSPKVDKPLEASSSDEEGNKSKLAVPEKDKKSAVRKLSSHYVPSSSSSEGHMETLNEKPKTRSPIHH